MMLSTLVALACLGCDVPLKRVAFDATVDVELVLAVDSSRSMDAEEFAMQRAGYVAAIRHPDFVAAVRRGAHGRIAVTYFEWAGTVREESLVSWHIVDGAESAERFALRIEERPFNSWRGTSISSAIDFAVSLFDENAVSGERRVVDVSGDGPNNMGTPVAAARDRAVEGGIVVNGLPILLRPSRTFQRLDLYYAECVTGGPGSFVLPVYDKAEFATAIRRKLILEVSGIEPGPRLIRAASEPVDCLKGERDRRLYSDPNFPELDR